MDLGAPFMYINEDKWQLRFLWSSPFPHAMLDSFIHSFIFTLVRVMVNLKPILGTLDVRQEYTLNEIPVHQRAPCVNTFTPRSNFEYPVH